MFRKRPLTPVDETPERMQCESEGKLFVSGYYNTKRKWVKGYCRKNSPFYHITEKKNLPSIAKNGLVPQQDNGIGSIEMKKGKVINVFLKEEDTDFMRNFFHTRAVADINYLTSDPVILELKVPSSKVTVVHKYKEDFVWGVIQTKVPSDNIKVKDVLYLRDRKNLEQIQREFRNYRRSTY